MIHPSAMRGNTPAPPHDGREAVKKVELTMRVPVEGTEDDIIDEGTPPVEDAEEPAAAAEDTDEEQEPEISPEDELLDTVVHILSTAGAYSVLHPGCGIGRWARQLADAGFQVTAFDLASAMVRGAAAAAQASNNAIRYLVDDPSLPTRQTARYDGLFAPDLLHQLGARERQRTLRLLSKCLRPGGVAVVTVLSTRDKLYGHGREVEPDTFEIVPGQTMHFFTEDELAYELERYFHVAFLDITREIETDHLGGRREYVVLVAGGIKRET